MDMETFVSLMTAHMSGSTTGPLTALTSSRGSARQMTQAEELEEERNLKWNHGLEVYFKDPANRDKTKMIVVYFNTPRTQALWAERFDRIIFSNQSRTAMRLNRSQRSVERSVQRSAYDDKMSHHSRRQFSMSPIETFGSDE